MAVSYSAKGALGYGTGAVNAVVPSGYSEGDLLVLVICGKDALPALPNGWTNINTTNNGTNVYNRTCYKIANATENTLSVADSGSYTVAGMYLFKGNNRLSPINITTENAPSGTSFSATGITTTVDACMIVHAAAFFDASSNDTSNYSSESNGNLIGLTERDDQYFRSSASVGGGIHILTGTKSTAGATGNTTATSDAAGNYSAVVTFAIIPVITHTLTIHYWYTGNAADLADGGVPTSSYSNNYDGGMPGTTFTATLDGNIVFAAATTHSSQVNEGSGYSVNSPSVTGFTAQTAIVSGTMGTSDVTAIVIYKRNACAVTATPDYTKIASNGVSTVAVFTDVNAKAFEARATLDGQSYGRGVGTNVISDDLTVDGGGVHTFATPTTSWSFDVAYSEINVDGIYRISVYTKNADDVWSS